MKLTTRQRQVLDAVRRGEVVHNPGSGGPRLPYDTWRPPRGRYARVTRTMTVLAAAGLVRLGTPGRFTTPWEATDTGREDDHSQMTTTANTTIHIGTMGESCASHGCPGCPAPADPLVQRHRSRWTRPVDQLAPDEQSATTEPPGRRPAVTWPHLSDGEPVKRYDLGDEVARRVGVWTVDVVCGKADVPTTLVTRRRDLTRCPDCLAVSPNHM